ELPARMGKPVNSGDELCEVLGLFRVAEVEAVGEAGRRRTDGDDVANRLAHRQLRGPARIDLAVAWISVDRERASKGRARNRKDHAGVGIAGRNRRRPAHDAVVPRKDRLTGADVVMPEDEL